MIIRKHIWLFLLLVSFVACESDVSLGKTKDKTEVIEIDSSKLSYIALVYEKAPALFKKNCAECHCNIGSNCEPPLGFKLKEYFENVSDKSLLTVVEILKDSSATKQNENSPNKYSHNLSKKIDDEQLKILIEYLRIESKK